MSYRRLAVASALFLLATYLKLFLPAYGQKVEPRLWEELDREALVLTVPADAAWLDLD